jgi:hypothetical protein
LPNDSNENYAEQLEASCLLRRRFRGGNAALAELYISEIENERDALRSELTSLQNSFGYKFMRLYGSIIDQTLPDGTKRGELKKRVLNLLIGSS